MKKFYSILLVICIILSCAAFTACSPENNPENKETSAAAAPAPETLEEAQRLAEKYAYALIENNYDTIFEYSAMDFKSAMEAMYSRGEMKEALEFYKAKDLADFYQKQHEKTVNGLKNSYGDDFKITVTAKSCNELDEETAALFIENCKIEADSQLKNYDIESKKFLDTEKISRVVKATLTCKTAGSKDSIEEVKVLYCVLMGKSWKIIDNIEF